MAKKPPPKSKRQTEIVRPPFVRGGALSVDDVEPFNDTEFNEISDLKRRLYLQAVARYPGLTMAARKAGVSPAAAYLWRHEGDPIFDAAYLKARRLGLTRAESELWRRGVEGYDKPIYHQGQLVGTERVFSDTAAIFMLKGAMPEKYRDRFEHSGPAGGPIEVNQTQYAALSDDEIRRRIGVALAALQQTAPLPAGDVIETAAVDHQATAETRYEAVVASRNGKNGSGSNGGGH